MAGFGPTGDGATGAWQTNLLWTGTNSWPVASTPVGSLPQYVYPGPPPAPFSQTDWPLTIQPRRFLDSFVAGQPLTLASFIPAWFQVFVA